MSGARLVFSLPPTSGSGARLVFGTGTVDNVTVDGTLPGLTLAAGLAAPNDATISTALPDLALAAGLAPPNDAAVTATLPALSLTFSGVGLTGLFYDATIDAALPALGLVVAAGPAWVADVDAAMPGLTISASVSWDVNVSRPLVSHVSTSAQKAIGVRAGVEGLQQAPIRMRASVTAEHRTAIPIAVDTADTNRRLDRLRPATALAHTTADGLRAQTSTSHQDMLRHARPSVGTSHQEAVDLRVAVATSHQERYRDRRPGVRTSHQTATPTRRGAGLKHQAASALRRYWGARHQEAMRPPIGTSAVVPPTPDVCYTPNGRLVFRAAAALGGRLVFSCDRHAGPGQREPIVVPVRRVYMVTNSVSLVRVTDGTPIPASSLSVSLDVDSWAWGFSAAIPASMLSLVEPKDDGPVELLATINGMPFHVLAEQVGRERSFGSAAVRVQGRGRIAELDAPYAPILSFGNDAGERTAQQLMSDVLTVNGVPMGWGVAWNLDDWLVPAGAWSHQGTYISALNAIAKAAGGYLHPHSSAKSLKVVHRYPTAPWEWDGLTPDLVLPADVARRESKTWLARPAYNRVFVQGQGQGLLGQVTREGTAGDFVAPLVVDPLMTEVAALRQRGRSELGQGGRQISVGLGLPVLAETGIVLPGTFVEYVDGADIVRGLVRSVSVEVGFPAVWQTIGVETHV